MPVPSGGRQVAPPGGLSGIDMMESSKHITQMAIAPVPDETAEPVAVARPPGAGQHCPGPDPFALGSFRITDESVKLPTDGCAGSDFPWQPHGLCAVIGGARRLGSSGSATLVKATAESGRGPQPAGRMTSCRMMMRFPEDDSSAFI